MGAWFEIYSCWETLGAQVLAAAFVVGSYYAAEYAEGQAPAARRSAGIAVRAEAPPRALAES